MLRHGGVLTGANGYDAYDQLAYVAWIRDYHDHLLASNLWQLGGTPHDYLHPMFFLSGLVSRLGINVQLAYLLWKPVALLVLFGGFSAYAQHLLPGRRRAQAAAVLLALFYESPVLAIADWGGHLSTAARYSLLFSGDDANAALNLWGFDHTAIALGLMPVCLIALDRARSTSGLGVRRWAAVAAVSGAMVSWLRPWQGAMLLIMMVGLVVMGRPRRRSRLVGLAALTTVLPLLYGVILARSDPSWELFQRHTIGVAPGPAWALLASFGPLLLLAILGLRRPDRSSDRELLLLLWVPACAAVYFVAPQFPPHALGGITLPLSILAVRGWSRIQHHLPRALAPVLAAAAVLLVTVPAAAYKGRQVWLDVSDPTHVFATELQVLSDDQAAVMRFIAQTGGNGGVLATTPLALSVPAFTGHPAYNGHFMWEPASQVAAASAFFAAGTPPAQRRAILRASGAEFVIVDCGTPPALAQAVAALAPPTARFGCMTVLRRRG